MCLRANVQSRVAPGLRMHGRFVARTCTPTSDPRGHASRLIRVTLPRPHRPPHELHLLLVLSAVVADRQMGSKRQAIPPAQGPFLHVRDEARHLAATALEDCLPELLEHMPINPALRTTWLADIRAGANERGAARPTGWSTRPTIPCKFLRPPAPATRAS